MPYYRNMWAKRSRPKPVSGPEQLQRRLLANDILVTLTDLGFERCERLETSFGDNSELVYAKPLCENKRYIIAVYTSCNQVGGAFVAKQKGKDAIRVAGLYIKTDGTATGIIKNKRVNRSGKNLEICKRMTARINKSIQSLSDYVLQDNNKCTACGSPTFTSRKGNQVCVEFCWRK